MALREAQDVICSSGSAAALREARSREREAQDELNKAGDMTFRYKVSQAPKAEARMVLRRTEQLFSALVGPARQWHSGACCGLNHLTAHCCSCIACSSPSFHHPTALTTPVFVHPCSARCAEGGRHRVAGKEQRSDGAEQAALPSTAAGGGEGGASGRARGKSWLRVCKSRAGICKPISKTLRKLRAHVMHTCLHLLLASG